MRFFLTGVFFFSISFLSAQLAPNTYWVQFTDKNNTIYSLDEPEVYLSNRSVERRERYNIPLDSTDLPINEWYLDSVVSKGATIVETSKWLNGVAVYTENSQVLEMIYALPFVNSSVSNSDAFTMLTIPFNEHSGIANSDTEVDDYGSAQAQIDLHQASILHENGYRGEGMLIAMLDAGYKGLDTISAFSSLFDNEQIRYTWDFVDNETNVYDNHYHGKACLSTIATNLSGEMIGSAPKADFLLFRTEHAYQEYKIEEIHWLAGAEMADSIGADIISSSLGYNYYDFPCRSYTWNDLTGHFAPISKGANLAGDKGILVFVSAGNEGRKDWRKITCPADAVNVLTVGACSSGGYYAGFSSQGNIVDGRVKPDIASVGQGTAVITQDVPAWGNGTSYATPLVAGLSACLWQVNRDKSNFEMMDLIRKHSSQYDAPDSLLGYGVPNFTTAYNDIVTDMQAVREHKEQLLNLYPSPFTGAVNFRFYAPEKGELRADIRTVGGVLVYTELFEVDSNKVNDFRIDNLSNLNPGVYIVTLSTHHHRFVRKMVKSE